MCLLEDWCNICGCQQLLKDLGKIQRFRWVRPSPPTFTTRPLPLQCQYALHRRRPGSWTVSVNANNPVLELICGIFNPKKLELHKTTNSHWQEYIHTCTVFQADFSVRSHQRSSIAWSCIFCPSDQWHAGKQIRYLKRLKKQTPWATTGASTNVSSFDPCFEPGLGPVSSLEPLFDPAVSLDPLFSTSSLDPLLTKPSSLDPLLDATSSLDPLLVRPGSSFDPFFLRGLWFGSSFVSLDPFAPGGLGHWHYGTKPNAFWGPHPYGKCYFCTHATNQGRYATEGNTSTWVKIFWALPGLFEPAFCLPFQKFASHSHFQTSRCKLGKFWHHQLTTCNLVSGRRLLSFFSAFSSFSVSALSTSSSCWWLTFCP